MQVLRDYIKKRGTIADVAQELGYSTSRVGHYLTGHRIPPTDSAIHIAAVTGIPLNKIRPDVYSKKAIKLCSF